MSGFIRDVCSKFHRFITYGIVGVVNTLVDFTFFTLCLKLWGLTPRISQVFGYLAGFTCGFILNRRVTFKDISGKLSRQLVLFLLVNCLSLSISSILIGILADTLNAFIAKILVSGIVLLINYSGYKYIVFRSSDNGKETGAQ